MISYIVLYVLPFARFATIRATTGIRYIFVCNALICQKVYCMIGWASMLI